MPVGFMDYQVTEKVMHTSERTTAGERGQSRDQEYACTGSNAGGALRRDDWSLLAHIL